MFRKDEMVGNAGSETLDLINGPESRKRTLRTVGLTFITFLVFIFLSSCHSNSVLPIFSRYQSGGYKAKLLKSISLRTFLVMDSIFGKEKELFPVIENHDKYVYKLPASFTLVYRQDSCCFLKFSLEKLDHYRYLEDFEDYNSFSLLKYGSMKIIVSNEAFEKLKYLVQVYDVGLSDYEIFVVTNRVGKKINILAPHYYEKFCFGQDLKLVSRSTEYFNFKF